MAGVRSKNTSPEMAVRRWLFARGYRYRLHRKTLPGCPDIVLARHKAAIFVHGCFWHGHGCAKGRLPKSRLEFWSPKIERNRSRDRDAVEALAVQGWRVLTIWQCETADSDKIAESLITFLEGRQALSKPVNANKQGTRGPL